MTDLDRIIRSLLTHQLTDRHQRVIAAIVAELDQSGTVEETRNLRIQVRVSPSEKAAIVARAADAHLDPSTYVRKRALEE